MTDSTKATELIKSQVWWDTERLYLSACDWWEANRKVAAGIKTGQWEALAHCADEARSFEEMDGRLKRFFWGDKSAETYHRGAVKRDPKRWGRPGLAEGLYEQILNAAATDGSRESEWLGLEAERLSGRESAAAIEDWRKASQARMFLGALLQLARSESAE